MGRHAKFSNDQILGAALALLSERGPVGVTMSGISRRTGAPIGSLYHRFPSRDHLMALLWLSIAESFQEGFLEALARGDGLSAALHTPRWVREHPSEGTVLLLFRREELIAGTWPTGVSERATALARQLDEGLFGFVDERFGSIDKEELGTVVFALIDVPYAAVSRYLKNGESPPPVVDQLIEKTYRSLMGDNNEDQKRP